MKKLNLFHKHKKSGALPLSQEKDHSTPLAICKGSLIALSMSLIGILIFAFILKFASISDSAIKPINQIIKAVSILFGVIVALKKQTNMGLIKGLTIGAIYTILAFVIFSILDGSMTFSTTIINDLIFGAIMGAVSGIIAVNFKKKTA